MSQITLFTGVKFLAWKSGCVKSWTNIMSESAFREFFCRGKSRCFSFSHGPKHKFVLAYMYVQSLIHIRNVFYLTANSQDDTWQCSTPKICSKSEAGGTRATATWRTHSRLGRWSKIDIQKKKSIFFFFISANEMDNIIAIESNFSLICQNNKYLGKKADKLIKRGCLPA